MFHSRSVSQPAFFFLDAISPLLSSPSTSPSDTSINSHESLSYTLSLPAYKPHRRSLSETQYEKTELNGEFTPIEMKKMMQIKNKKLVDMALADPKRVKRILANRQSAARSKEKKIIYVKDLEHKVHIMQNQNSALSAQLNILHRESAKIASQNNELKIRLHALQQQAHLRNILNEVLRAEVQRLKLNNEEITL